jgi:protein Tex
VSASLPPEFEPWFKARHPDIPVGGARAVFDLAAAGGTVPFIARYRRDRTNGLDEEAVRRALLARDEWEKLVSRQDIILESIVRHATLAPDLRERIRATFDAVVLEDLYQPFRQKKKSRADAAREAGLSPLADWIWGCGHGTETPQEGQTLELWAFTFRDQDKGVPDARTAIEGARDILVERLADDVDLRVAARAAYMEEGWLRATRTEKAKPGGRFEPYFAFQEKVKTLLAGPGSQRYLALRRGQSEGELQLAVGGPPDDTAFEDRLAGLFESKALTVADSPGAEVLRQAARIAFKGLVRSAMENDVHRALKDAADHSGASVFAESVRRTLLEAPFGPRAIVGVSVSRETAHAAAVSAESALVASASVPFQGDEGKAAAGPALAALVKEHAAEAVAVGHSPQGRDVELLVRGALREAGLAVPVVLVSDAGANALAASDAARAEHPDAEPGVRAAVSIARRFQDPLAELVKLEMRHLGAGQYPHDVSTPVLHRATDAAIESCVHAVGVNASTASARLLARVAGLSPALAEAIVERRAAAGPLRRRAQLLEVPGLEATAYEQAAGFLRVPGGENPLDATRVHPEHYPALEGLAGRHGKTVADLLGAGASLAKDDAALREALGPLTHDDVVRELESPGRDPRPEFEPFSFREDVRRVEDLRPGLVCPGIVSHVTSFGAFVDVGVGHDGLVHVSQLGRKGSGDPRLLIHPGERVQVRVVKVDLEKRQVSLSLRPAPPRREAAPRPRRAEGERTGARDGRSAKPDSSGKRPQSPPSRSSRPRPEGKRPSEPPPRRPGSRPPGERRPAFNNPFAVLADLKITRRK